MATLFGLPLLMTGVQAVVQPRFWFDALTQLCTKDAGCDVGVFCNGQKTSDLQTGQNLSGPFLPRPLRTLYALRGEARSHDE